MKANRQNLEKIRNYRGLREEDCFEVKARFHVQITEASGARCRSRDAKVCFCFWLFVNRAELAFRPIANFSFSHHLLARVHVLLALQAILKIIAGQSQKKFTHPTLIKHTGIFSCKSELAVSSRLHFATTVLTETPRCRPNTLQASKRSTRKARFPLWTRLT